MDNGPLSVDTAILMVGHRVVACGAPTEVSSHVEVSELPGLQKPPMCFRVEDETSVAVEESRTFQTLWKVGTPAGGGLHK